MAARNETDRERYWTLERVLQLGVPVALVTGVILLILVQLVTTPRGSVHPPEQMRSRAAPTAAVTLITPQIDTALAAESAPTAEPTTMQAQEPTMAMPAETLPTIASINCQRPTSPEDVAACALTNAQDPLPQVVPAGVGQDSGRVQGDSASFAPTVNDQPSTSDIQPIATSAVPLCSEVTRPIGSCRGSRP